MLDRPGVVWALGSAMNWDKGEIFYLREQGTRLTDDTSPVRSVETLTGCGTLVPAQCYREVGLYDATWFPQYHADAEFVLRAVSKGWIAVVDSRSIVRNDAPNSAAAKVQKWSEWLLSRRSAAYWRPLLAIHLRYCPHRLRIRSLCQFYGWYFWRNDDRVRRFGWWLKPVTKWWRALEQFLHRRSADTTGNATPRKSLQRGRSDQAA
jgi:GT2 family glycosyltransferase